MEQDYYLIVKCTFVDNDYDEEEPVREPILITTESESGPWDGVGYEIYHIETDGMLTLEKECWEDYT